MKNYQIGDWVWWYDKKISPYCYAGKIIGYKLDKESPQYSVYLIRTHLPLNSKAETPDLLSVEEHHLEKYNVDPKHLGKNVVAMYRNELSLVCPVCWRI